MAPPPSPVKVPPPSLRCLQVLTALPSPMPSVASKLAPLPSTVHHVIFSSLQAASIRAAPVNPTAVSYSPLILPPAPPASPGVTQPSMAFKTQATSPPAPTPLPSPTLSAVPPPPASPSPNPQPSAWPAPKPAPPPPWAVTRVAPPSRLPVAPPGTSSSGPDPFRGMPTSPQLPPSTSITYPPATIA